jgi:hypothetical protein
MGRGIFSSILPLISRALPFLGRTLLNTAVNVAEEYKQNNEADVKDVLRKSAAKSVDEGLDKMKTIARKQIMGGGRKRKAAARSRPVVGHGRKKARKSKKKTVKGVTGGRKGKRAKGRKHIASTSPYLF